MQEIQKLSAEKKANEAKMQVDLSKQEASRKLAKIEADQTALDEERKQLDGEWDTMCGRWNCTGPKYGRGGQFVVQCNDDASCESTLNTYNSKTERINSRRSALNAAEDAAKKPAGSYDALAQRNREIDAQIRSLQLRIDVEKTKTFKQLSQGCMTAGAGIREFDASRQAMDECWDKALAPSQVPTVEVQSGRYWREQRAAQEAIDKYLRSGVSRGGSTTFQPVVVPMPDLREAPPSK
jgi:hypothetical protein